jgi:uncharacterized protein (DUF1499 family)
MAVLKWLLVTLLALGAFALIAGQMGMLAGTAPTDLGVHQGKLKAPSSSPNSVSSQADLWPTHPRRTDASIPPLALVGDPAQTLERLKAVVLTTPGARIVEARADYLRAEFTTRLMKFTDDAEFWLDPAAGVIQVRSASRLGESDMGVNRGRIEEIRKRLAASAR